MSSLRQIKNRIQSVTATRQMTSSMKMIAVSRLKKKHAAFLQAVPFADEMNRAVRRLVRSIRFRREDDATALPPLLAGTGQDKRYIIVMMTSDEGLSGTACVQIAAQTRKLAAYLSSEDKEVHIFAYGSRGAPLIRRHLPDIPVIALKQRKSSDLTAYLNAEVIAADLMTAFNQSRFDTCLVVYNRFDSIIKQTPIIEQLIPNKTFLKDNPWDFLNQAASTGKNALKHSPFLTAIGGAEALSSLQDAVFKTTLDTGKRAPDVYDYAPDDTDLLTRILPQHITAYVYRVLLEADVSDSAARLMAMEQATHSADEMLEILGRTYRRTRQTRITTDIAEGTAAQPEENRL